MYFFVLKKKFIVTNIDDMFEILLALVVIVYVLSSFFPVYVFLYKAS